MRRVQRDDQEREVAEEWEDVTTVKAPPRTKRRTIIKRGLEQAQMTGERLEVRVLDARSAHVSRVNWRTPEPQLEIE